MLISSLFSVLCFAILNHSVLSMALQSNQGEERNLAQYETLAPFRIGLDMNNRERLEVESHIRGFLWDHWSKRRLGYLVVTRFSKEGAETLTKYFVETDSDGKLVITIVIKRELIDLRGEEGRKMQESKHQAYNVARLAEDSLILRQAKELSPEDVTPPANYRLLLKDNQGAVIQQI